MSLLQNSEAEGAGINPAPTKTLVRDSEAGINPAPKTRVGEGFIPSLPNCCFIDETEGGPRPTLRRTQNLRGLVGWALAHLQSRSRIFGVSERSRGKRRGLQEAQLIAIF